MEKDYLNYLYLGGRKYPMYSIPKMYLSEYWYQMPNGGNYTVRLRYDRKGNLKDELEEGILPLDYYKRYVYNKYNKLGDLMFTDTIYSYKDQWIPKEHPGYKDLRNTYEHFLNGGKLNYFNFFK